MRQHDEVTLTPWYLRLIGKPLFRRMWFAMGEHGYEYLTPSQAVCVIISPIIEGLEKRAHQDHQEKRRGSAPAPITITTPDAESFRGSRAEDFFT